MIFPVINENYNRTFCECRCLFLITYILRIFLCFSVDCPLKCVGMLDIFFLLEGSPTKPYLRLSHHSMWLEMGIFEL